MPVWKFDFSLSHQLLSQPYNKPWVPSASSSLPSQLHCPSPGLPRGCGRTSSYTLKTPSLFTRTSSVKLHLELARALPLSGSCLLPPSSHHGQREDQYEKKYIAHLLSVFTVESRCPQNVVPWGCSSVSRVLNWQAGSLSSVPITAQTGCGGGPLQSHQKEMEKGSEVQSHLWLCSQFKASLNYIQACLKDRWKTKQRSFLE